MTNNFIHIGFIKKVFGNKSELIVYSVDNLDLSFLNANDWIFINIDGDTVPFQIEYIDAETDNTAIIKLRDVATEQAKKLIGSSLHITIEFAEKNNINRQLDFKSVKGFKVIDKAKGEIGFVSKVIEKPHQHLLQIDFENKQILIPVDENIIKKVNLKNKTINITAPDGLIDLYLNA